MNLSPGFSPADQLLCSVLRGDHAVWPTSSEKDFEQSVVQQARHHGVQALVFEQVHKKRASLNWPESVMMQLSKAARAGVVLEMFRATPVASIFAELSRRGIPFLVTKGEALARTHYPVPGTRTRCDIDMFIAIQDIERARQVVVDAGFSIVSVIYKTHQFTARLMQNDSVGLELDIHWRILNSARFARTISFDEAWAKSVELPQMHGVRTLSPIHALMLACMHRTGSSWHDQNRLIWLYDIHLLVGAMTPGELTAFAREAVARNVQRTCLEGLCAARSYLNTGLFDDVYRILNTPEKTVTLSQRYQRSHLGLLVDDFMVLPGMQSKLRLLKELFFPPARDVLQNYGTGNKIALPWLYIDHAIRRVWQRLSLR